VSRLWPDEIGAYIAPRRVCLVRLRRGSRRRLAREEEVAVGNTDQNGWVAALAALEARLKDPLWQGGRLHVMLADHWVRYVVVPYAPDLDSGEERLAHARALLAGSYGDPVNDWLVCLSEAPPGASRLACAMPAELLADLRELCVRCDTKLAALQPQLVAGFNFWRHRMPESGAWFVTIEAGSLAAVRVAADGFDRVHTVRIGADWSRELKRLQTFGRLAKASAADGRVFVDAPQTWRPAGIASGPELEWLEEAPQPTTTLHWLENMRRVGA